MSESEFSRIVDLRHFPDRPQELAATPEECAALARRFLLVTVNSLSARITLTRYESAVSAVGRIHADIVQSCAVSGEDLPATIDEEISLRFVPEAPPGAPDEEIELAEDDLDEIPYQDNAIDLGEAVAQSMALAIDPYAIGPQAKAARARAGIVDEAASGPFAALAALKKQD